jgi:hypothetical protein
MKLLLGQLNESVPSDKMGLAADMDFTKYTPKPVKVFSFNLG